jgi:hypothetical protein
VLPWGPPKAAEVAKTQAEPKPLTQPRNGVALTLGNGARRTYLMGSARATAMRPTVATPSTRVGPSAQSPVRRMQLPDGLSAHAPGWGPSSALDEKRVFRAGRLPLYAVRMADVLQRRRVLIAGVAVVAAGAGGFLVGRATDDDDPPTPSPDAQELESRSEAEDVAAPPAEGPGGDSGQNDLLPP